MSDPHKPLTTPPQTTPVAVATEGNPAFRMMGLPRLRAKLPSRNWTIFLTVVGSFSAAVIYDRRQRSKAQQKWCNAVSHLSTEVLPTNCLPRKYTIYLAAPPGDGLRAPREHFQEYVKPILVAAAVDWDVVEGRNEGELRAKVAERVRHIRQENGETSSNPQEDDILSQLRQKTNIQNEGSAGEIIIGRHTWKEYIRGIHEGWLGPLNPQLMASSEEPIDADNDFPSTSPGVEPKDVEMPDNATSSDSPEKTEESKKIEAPPKPSLKSPYILPAEYKEASLASTAPSEFATTLLLPEPHLLGFLNTPIRIYRFLNRRYIAEETGLLVSSLLLSNTPDQQYETLANESDNAMPTLSGDEEEVMWEQQRLLSHEERDWHKISRKPNPPEDANRERPWTEPMVVDSRIGSRMKKRQPLSTDIYRETAYIPGHTSQPPTRDVPQIQGNSLAWKGGAARPEHIGWGQWLLESLGFDHEEPQCKGWEHGEVADGS